MARQNHRCALDHPFLKSLFCCSFLYISHRALMAFRARALRPALVSSLIFLNGIKESQWRHILVFLSQYPTVNTLLENWKALTAEFVSSEDATEEVSRLLKKITLDLGFDKKLWPQFRFFALVQPDSDIFPVRAPYDPSDSKSLALAGGQLTWALVASDSTYASTATIHHFNVYFTDVAGNLYIAASNLPVTTSSLDLSTLVPAGTWSVYVEMVGQLLIINRCRTE